ncbi:hypothetical protein [Brevibacillus massiliensis]|uniref:hypothetical protein n=1 Tax=Brevibacillus massiliensis TaxID=1118054 RepID=UPI0002D9A91A|nr:hypothetical protein [Brevibacillus massiliensis]
MDELIGRRVQIVVNNVKKRGVIEFVDQDWIVVYCKNPRNERVVYPNNEKVFERVKFLDEK